MQNSIKRTLSLILVLCSCLSMLLLTVTQADAASITVFSQNDSRWKNHQYGYKDNKGTPATIGSGGCGILSLVNAVYYMNGNFIDPIALADWSVDKGYRVNGVGTSHGLYPAYSKAYGNTYGFSCSSSEGTGTWDTLKSHLINGGTAIVPTVTRATGSAHLLVIADYDSSSGKYLVLDSYASSNRGTSSGYAWMTKATFQDRMSCSKFILINNTAGSSGTHTHSYSGSYYESAHPHKVYQKCSCGATQYTGGTTKVDTCETCNPVNTSSKYNTVLPFKAYLKGTSTVYPYSSAQLASQTGGEIWSNDECTISAVYSNGACKVTYPAGSTTKTAYAKLSDFIGDTSASLNRQTANRQITTYIRSSTGSTAYGYVSSGDVIYTLGTSGNMTQIFYPTSSGYKLAWVVTSDINYVAPTYDTRFNPYCPIKGYPCATANFTVYKSDHSTKQGTIYTSDYCTINHVYADGWCEVTYPTSSGNKTAYTPLNNFVYNVSANHMKYTANAQIKVHKTKNLPGDVNWYVSSGDQFFVVGSYGGASQVLYPIDAQYGGGYKLGWINTNDLPKTTYTVSYNANGGNGAPGNQTKNHGTALTLSTTAPTRAGHSFVGWATSASATSATYAPGASYNVDANLPLYAVWKVNKYEVTYNANGGTNAPTAQNKTHGTVLTLTKDIPVKNYTVTFNANGGTVDVSSRQVNCEFLGWSTSSSASSAAYQPGGSFSENANTILYAVWKNPTLEQYSIPVRSGYVFDGWYTEVNGGTQVMLSTVVSSDMTVYAHWEMATYEVTYDANGGEGAPDNQVKTHGKNLTISSTIPTKENNIFLGWATEEYPDTVQYHPGDAYSVDSDIMLIAVWEQATLTNIEISAKPEKTTYYVGDTLDATGLKLTLSYSDGHTEVITNGFSCSPNVLDVAGTQTIEVTYGGKTATFTVTVVEIQITELKLAKQPDKTTYYVGEQLDTTGLELEAIYSNGTSQTITGGFTCNPKNLNTVGTQNVTVSYGGKSVTFDVLVKSSPTAVLSIGSDSGMPGETVTIAVKLDQNPGLIGARMKISYDTNSLTLTEVKDGGILGEYQFGSDLSACPYIVLWENGLADTDFTAAGNLVYLTFRISENAPAGKLPVIISYDPEDVYNKDLVNVGLSITQGTIEVIEKENPNAPKIIVSTPTGSAGQQVNVEISLENNPGVASMMLSVDYDPEVLTLVAVEDRGHIGTAVHSDNLSTHPYLLTWANDLATENYTYSGEIATLTFRIADNADTGKTAITVSYDYENFDIFNVEGEQVRFTAQNGFVKISDVLVGDVNNDGRVNAQDRMILTRYLAKWTGYTEDKINIAASDVNGDGRVNAQDRMILTRYLAKWTGYETLS